MDIEVRKVVENKNRTFYAIWADGAMVCTYIWFLPLAELVARALKEHTEKYGEESLRSVLES